MNKKILITDSVHPLMLSAFKEMGFELFYNPDISLEEVHTIIHDFHGLIINSKIIVDTTLIQKARSLEFVGRLGSGMEIVDIPYCLQYNIAIFSSPNGNNNAVAEHALGMLLALSNNLMKSNTEVKNFIWNRESNRGFEIQGKTIGIIGFGHTGSAFAKKLSSLDMKILTYDKYLKNYHKNIPYITAVESLEAIQKEADIISFHLPLTPECIGYANQSFFNRCEKNIIVINTSRGKVIPTQVLLDNLSSGKITGACLDVFENEKPETYSSSEKMMYRSLFEKTNVIVSPHIAGWTQESKVALSKILVEKVRDFYGL